MLRRVQSSNVVRSPPAAQLDQCKLRAASADAPPPPAKGGAKARQPRSRLSAGRPKITNRNEEPKVQAQREAARKRAAEHRERIRKIADRKIGDFEYDGRLLTWLEVYIRPHTGKPYLTEEAIALGQSERRTDLRRFDLALRGAVTAFFDDLVKGHVVL